MLNKLHDSTQAIAAVWGKMLRDANFAKEGAVSYTHLTLPTKA